MSSVAPPRGGLGRALLGLGLVVVSACLVTWGAFETARVPAACGGSYDPCGGDGVLSFVGAIVALVILGPLGCVLAWERVQSVAPALTALSFGGAAVAVYASRFVAAPVVEGTAGTWVAAGLLAAIALLAALAIVGSAPSTIRRAQANRAARASRTAPASTSASATAAPDAAAPGRAARPAGAASARPGATSATRRPAPGAPTPVPGMTAVHDLLAHGLAGGGLAAGAAAAGTTPAAGGRDRVVQLLDLHRQGVLGDDELRVALQGLRDPG